MNKDKYIKENKEVTDDCYTFNIGPNIDIIVKAGNMEEAIAIKERYVVYIKENKENYHNNVDVLRAKQRLAILGKE